MKRFSLSILDRTSTQLRPSRHQMVDFNDGEIELRIILDRWSMELFVNKGKQAASMKIDTEAPADKITFSSDRPVLMDLDLFTIEH